MEYRALGRTGIKVSRLGLGCGNFGGIGSDPRFFGQGESERDAFRLMDAAFDIGVNFFDTADAYGGGASEAFIGRWLKTKDKRARDQVLLSSKVFNSVGDGPNDRGLSRRHIKRQIDASLARLGAERLDLYLVHEPDPETPLEETLSALHDLVRAGKVHYLGASNFEAWRLARARALSDDNGWARFEWVQNDYSLLSRTQEAEVLPLCARDGIGFTPFSPLAGGWLTGKYRTRDDYPEGSRMTLRPEPYAALENDRVFAAIDAFEKAAKARGVSMGALAMAWVLSHPQTTAIITGPRKPEHLDTAKAAQDIALSEAERNQLSGLFEG
jgi:aryl-alcohol dehydrogenase-like predicted oxidoreductase